MNEMEKRSTARSEELADVSWHISTKSENGGGSCVEAGPLGDGSGRVAVRHSHRPDGQVIVYTRREWQAFIAGVMAVEDSKIGENETMQTLDKSQGGQEVLNGTVCRVKAIQRSSKKSKDEQGNPYDYSIYSWSPSLTDAEIVQALGEEAVKRFFPNGL